MSVALALWALIEAGTLDGPVGAQARQEARRLGIDVASKYADIRKITLAHFSRSGLDAEDLVQEVLLAIHRRNSMPRSAFDPQKSSFSHYTFMIARNCVANAIDKQKRHGRVSLEDQMPEDVVDERDEIAAFEHVKDSLRISKARPLDRTKINGGRAVLN